MKTGKQEIITTAKQIKRTEPWVDRHWRNAAAVVYFIICLFDFVVMPAMVYYKDLDKIHAIEDLIDQDKYTATNDKEYAIKIIDRITNEQWEPITLMNGGIFHISYGAILTGATLMWMRDKKNKS